MTVNQSDQEHLDLQRVQILYQQAGFTLMGVLVSSLVIGYIIYPVLPWQVVLAWIVAALSVIPIRLILLNRFRSDVKKGLLSVQKARVWERRWYISSSLPALTFASSSYLPYNDNQLVIFLFIGLVMASMVAGSILSSITSIKTVMVFMSLSMLPFIVKCFTETGEFFWTLGYFFIAFYVVFLSLSLRMNRTMQEAIEQKIARQDMAYKDSLTGLWNRRKLFSVLERIENKTYGLLLIDVDHFKQFNDKHGHSKGDDMLSDISLSILRCARERDLVVRYGGEEFLVFLPETMIETAEQLAHGIRERVVIDCGSTVSIGVADTQLETDFDALVELADQALYQAKREGRNCVRTAQQPLHRDNSLAKEAVSSH